MASTTATALGPSTVVAAFDEQRFLLIGGEVERVLDLGMLEGDEGHPEFDRGAR